MTTRREIVKDSFQEFLMEHLSFTTDKAYEAACDLADIVFEELGYTPEEQDRELE